MTRRRLRLLIILVVTASAAVLWFQFSWLKRNYAIQRASIRQEIAVALDSAINEQASLLADSVRVIMKQLLRSKDDFGYRLFGPAGNRSVGIQLPGGKGSYWFQRLTSRDEISLNNNSYTFLVDLLNKSSLHKLEGIWSVTLGSHDSPEGTLEDSLEWRIVRLFDAVADSARIREKFERNLNHVDLPEAVSFRFYKNIQRFYLHDLPLSMSGGQPGEVISTIGDAGDDNLDEKVSGFQQELEYLNGLSDTTFTGKFLFFNVENTLTGPSGFVTSVVVPSSFILKRFAVNILLSFLLVIFIAGSMIYLYYTISRQRRLAAIKNDFISNISHELKTPVATALAAVQSMQHFGVLEDRKRTIAYLSTTEQELKRLSLLISKILNTTAFDNEAFRLNAEVFNLKNLLLEVAASQSLRREKPVHIRIEYSGKEEVTADRMHLQNVFINLIDNAIKYSGQSVAITISAEVPDRELIINVTDDGNGIPKTFRHQVFDRFFRVPANGTHDIKGHGLGLSYVQSIVQAHGGTIAVTNSSESGTTFTINLPLYA